jgi:hypothetical protein
MRFAPSAEIGAASLRDEDDNVMIPPILILQTSVVKKNYPWNRQL